MSKDFQNSQRVEEEFDDDQGTNTIGMDSDYADESSGGSGIGKFAVIGGLIAVIAIIGAVCCCKGSGDAAAAEGGDEAAAAEEGDSKPAASTGFLAPNPASEADSGEDSGMPMGAVIAIAAVGGAAVIGGVTAVICCCCCGGDGEEEMMIVKQGEKDSMKIAGDFDKIALDAKKALDACVAIANASEAAPADGGDALADGGDALADAEAGADGAAKPAAKPAASAKNDPKLLLKQCEITYTALSKMTNDDFKHYFGEVQPTGDGAAKMKVGAMVFKVRGGAEACSGMSKWLIGDQRGESDEEIAPGALDGRNYTQAKAPTQEDITKRQQTVTGKFNGAGEDAASKKLAAQEDLAQLHEFVSASILFGDTHLTVPAGETVNDETKRNEHIEKIFVMLAVHAALVTKLNASFSATFGIEDLPTQNGIDKNKVFRLGKASTENPADAYKKENILKPDVLAAGALVMRRFDETDGKINGFADGVKAGEIADKAGDLGLTLVKADAPAKKSTPAIEDGKPTTAEGKP